MSEPWTQADAVLLCKLIEDIAPEYGCHVALTGGLLYKTGPRKDADILFYRIRQANEIDLSGLFEGLALLGIESSAPLDRFVVKATWRGKSIDFMFPEASSDLYERPEPDSNAQAAAEAEAKEILG